MRRCVGDFRGYFVDLPEPAAARAGAGLDHPGSRSVSAGKEVVAPEPPLGRCLVVWVPEWPAAQGRSVVQTNNNDCKLHTAPVTARLHFRYFVCVCIQCLYPIFSCLLSLYLQYDLKKRPGRCHFENLKNFGMLLLLLLLLCTNRWSKATKARSRRASTRFWGTSR